MEKALQNPSRLTLYNQISTKKKRLVLLGSSSLKILLHTWLEISYNKDSIYYESTMPPCWNSFLLGKVLLNGTNGQCMHHYQLLDAFSRPLGNCHLRCPWTNFAMARKFLHDKGFHFFWSLWLSWIKYCLKKIKTNK